MDADRFLSDQLLGGTERVRTHDAVTLDALYKSRRAKYFDERNLTRDGMPPKWAQSARPSVLHHSDPVICRLKALMSPDGELGPLIRLSLLAVEVGRALFPKANARERDDLLTNTVAATCKAAGSQAPPPGAWYPREEVDPHTSGARGGRAPLTAADVLAPDAGKRALIVLANQHLRAPRCLPPLTWDGLMETPLRQVERMHVALTAYRNWLCQGDCLVHPRRGFDLGETSDVIDNHPEVLAITERVRQLALQSLAERRPIVQLHAVSHATLGRAMLRHLCSADACDEHGLMPIHLEASRFDDPDFAFTAKGFLAPLGRAFGIDLGDLSQPFTDQELAEVVDLLRRALTRHGALVIVHGLSNASGATAAVLDFITGGDVVMDLVRSLTLPAAALEETVSPARTLWVTLSTHSVASWLPLSAEVFDLDAHSWTLSGNSARWEDIRLTWVGKTNPGTQATVAMLGGRIPRLMPDLKDWLVPSAIPSDLELLWLSTLGQFQKLKRPHGPTQTSTLDRSRLLARLAVEQWASANAAGFWLLVVVAVTPEGVCLGTLRRLVERAGALLAMNRREEASHFRVGSDLDNLLKRLQGSHDAATDFSDEKLLQPFKPLLGVAKEQVTQLYLSERTLRWEVGALGRGARAAGAGSREGEFRGEFRRLLRFSSAALRDQWLDAVASLGDGPRKVVALLQHATGLEAYAQSTAMLAHSQAGDLLSLRRRRLLVQALHHCCQAGSLDDLSLTGSSAGQPVLADVPSDAKRRRHFCYAVLYRQLIEDRAWLLSRRFARDDLRLALLRLQLRWGWEERPFLPPEKAAETAELAALDPGPAAPVFWRQFLVNLAHAALDAEHEGLITASLDTIDSLGDGAPMPLQPLHYDRLVVEIRAFEPIATVVWPKLEFSRLNDAGQLEAAEALCRRHIKRLAPKLPAKLTKAVIHVRKLIGAQSPDGLRSDNPILMRLIQIKLHAQGQTQVADWCLRLADVIANRAEEREASARLLPDVAQRKSALENAHQLALEGWVTFWAADMLRARVGEQPGVRDGHWGRLAPRFYRSGVRLSLRLARQFADREDLSFPWRRNLADYMLDYARTRIGIHVRDDNALARERFHMPLLWAALVRVKARVETLLGSPMGSVDADARAYLREAEFRWVELGAPPALTRRLLVERIMLAEASAWTSRGEERQAILKTIEVDLQLLEGYAKSLEGEPLRFWARRLRYHRDNTKALKNSSRGKNPELSP